MTETEVGTETGIEGDGSNESAIDGQIKLNLLLPRNEFISLFTSFWWGILVKLLLGNQRSEFNVFLLIGKFVKGNAVPF